MDSIEVAKLKDRVLEHILKQENHQQNMKPMYDDLKIKDISLEVFESYLREMGEDDTIQFYSVKYNATIHTTKHTERFLLEGGYTQQAMDEAAMIHQAEEDAKQERLQRDLSIKALKFQVKDYFWTKLFTIIAILVSVVSLLLSIFLD